MNGTSKSIKKPLIRISIVFLIILSILSSFIFYNQWPLWTGKELVIATMPLDPFDPFRGQYMNINYEISRMTASGFEVGDTVYVSLEEDNESIWRPVEVLREKPLQGDFIRGKVKGVYGGTLSIRYGIEQFFFEKNAKVPTQNITADIRVVGSGRAKLVGLLQNGEPIEIEYEEFDLRN